MFLSYSFTIRVYKIAAFCISYCFATHPAKRIEDFSRANHIGFTPGQTNWWSDMDKRQGKYMGREIKQ
jgi:hypothetical protein